MIRKTTIPAALLFFAIAVLLSYCQQPENKRETEQEEDTVRLNASDSLDAATGLVIDDALPLVIGNCTACHSAKLITQNRASREGWKNMIVWMQETQKLWDLGENEDQILDYLAEHYAPEAEGRRKNLKNIEWYDLK